MAEEAGIALMATDKPALAPGGILDGRPIDRVGGRLFPGGIPPFPIFLARPKARRLSRVVLGRVLAW
jgi:hypothetical protein